ncbi:MAG: RNA polymerase sigma factor [Myxococcales bacterium]|nr:RNA polymerase sigma factor [Myxococcales bacterium]
MPLALRSWLASAELVEPNIDGDVGLSLGARAKAGDQLAMRLVYERYAPAVRRFIRDMLRDGQAADDALQDTFIRVTQGIGSLDEPEHLAGWIFGIARRVCFEHRRHRTRRQRNTELTAADFEAADSSATPEALYFGSRAAEKLDRAVDRLEPDRRAILLLRCDHQLSYEEIATAMGFSLSKVKVELHRARLALREVFREMGES